MYGCRVILYQVTKLSSQAPIELFHVHDFSICPEDVEVTKPTDKQHISRDMHNHILNYNR